ncbi:MAG TPA: gamma-glutamyltransferase, partial [Paraburkholderia sp.]
MSHPNGPRTGRPSTRAPHGMVSTPHYLASQAGVEMLQRGGSAADAAIAANAVLCVAYPHMAGLGGDGFWLIADGNGDKVHGINASGPAAQAATIARYRSGTAVDEIAARGPQAALTVPGAIDGWRLAHERFGHLPWADLFAPAIGYARDGVPVARSLVDWTVQDVPILTRFPETAAVFMPGGRVPADGDRLVQAALAQSLQQLAEHGARAGFYEGELAARICKGIGAAGSPLQAGDFAAYHAEW